MSVWTGGWCGGGKGVCVGNPLRFLAVCSRVAIDRPSYSILGGETFRPVPGTWKCSVHARGTLPTSCFVHARSFCEFCTPAPQDAEFLEFLYDSRTRTRKLFMFCKIPIALPGTFVTSVRLWHNTRGTGTPCYNNTQGSLYSFRFYP